MDLGELEARARELLAPGSYDYVAGGAGPETTLVDNEAAWRRLRLRPRVLRDVAKVSTTTTLLGTELPGPVGIAPSAFHRIAHPEAEAATARGAAAAGALYVVSSRASTGPAEIAAAAPGAPRWFQVYVFAKRSLTTDLVAEAREAGYQALVLTGDTPVLGRRLRDERNAFTLPAEAQRPYEPSEGVNHLGPLQDPSVTFDDIAWLREQSGLPVIVKGVLRADDAVRCLEAGAAGVWVSNHGGRQLDGAVAPADALAEVAGAVGAAGEVYVDGGVRSGVDVVRALALGARAVLVGRPVVWGLATGGADGVREVLEAFHGDLVLAMRLCGAATLRDCSADLLAR